MAWRLEDADSLARGAAAGAFLETYVVSEAMKGAFNRGQRPDFTFYRDHNGREVDILSIDGKTLTAVEVKTTCRPDGRTGAPPLDWGKPEAKPGPRCCGVHGG